MMLRVRLPDGTTVLCSDLSTCYVNEQSLLDLVQRGEAEVTIVAGMGEVLFCPLCGSVVSSARRGTTEVSCQHCGKSFRVEVRT